MKTKKLHISIVGGFMLSWATSPTKAIDLAEALDTTNLVWTTSGSQIWVGQTNVTHDGSDAAGSGPVAYPLVADLKTVVTGPGTLTFWWRATNQVFSTTSPLSFSTDGNYTEAPSLLGWQQTTVYLGPNSQTCRWSCASSGFFYSTGWVDQVTYTPGPTSPQVLNRTGNTTVPAGSDLQLSVFAAGTPPLIYQWRVGGSNILGATNGSLLLTNVQAAAAGIYDVTVTNNYGVTNPTVILTVNPSAPRLITQPYTREMVPGVTVTFTGAARGSEPMHYQWQYNGADLQGMEGLNLELPNIQTNNAGVYRVIVSNGYGSTNSSSASLIVVPMVIVGWGDNFFGEINVPWGLTNVAALGCGGDFSVAVNKDQPVVDWGFALADFPTNLTNVVALAGGSSHAIALGSDGVVTTVGGGPYTPPPLTNVVQIGAGGSGHRVVLQSDGRVIAWGGQAGTPQTNAPTDLTNAIAIAGGWWHDLAIRSDGTVVAWGVNNSASTTMPVGLSGVVAVASAGDQSLALRANGTVVAWGYNGYGQTNVPTGLSNVVAVSGGEMDCIALKSDGTVVAWGGGFSGQTNVPAWLKQVVAIASGPDHHLALLTDGSPYFTRQPYSQTIFSGATVTFNPVVLGKAPFAFQWKFNGADIPGATNLSLALSNTALSGSGAYWCTASNGFKVVTSLPAYLTVLRSRPRFISPSGMQFTNGLLTLQLTDCSGHGNLIVYGSSDLRAWSPLLTNPPVVGDLKVRDAFATNFIRRFYRAEEE